jgi:hypothetical protein
MSNMVLGAYTFAQHPSDIDGIMVAEKSNAWKQTYTSVAYFSWGTSIVGKSIEMSWDYMSCDQYDAIDTLFQADASVVFDPQDGSSKTYNVEIVDLTGKYHIGLTHSEDWERMDVKMTLLILSEV